ncbi:NAD(P)/FAD-dependent oxidoreductase [Chondromyces crocatus]|uniref:Oxidoreductase n=1 Tax=Chondromyces crocatus TaxID=52 RepID=A0A0K1EML8_CHOCO|nr:tryptophan 7-halogenase [Chondromyces crocatus]AKT42099.1 oxidoreductase [Chondromyces crocatus]
MKRHRHHEVVIAGGGPAGAAAAIVLARAGRDVLLVDAAAEGAFRVGEALPPAARPLLRDLGVLERVEADGHLRCHGNVSAWGDVALRGTDFLFGVNGAGWHVDRARFDASLRVAARDVGAEVLGRARIGDVERAPGGGFALRVVEGEEALTLSCDALIDATGRSSAVARRLGASRSQEDALVAFFVRFRSRGEAMWGASTLADRDGRTLIEAERAGWWYSARVPSGERVVAFLTDPDLADRKVLLSEEGFGARVRETRAVQEVLARHGYVMGGRPRGIDAGSARLDRFGGEGWLAVGDAALSFDPLSSQGMMNALYTGLRAGEALLAWRSGDGGGVARYLARLEAIHAAYRENLALFYGQERRWVGGAFWQRRVRMSP